MPAQTPKVQVKYRIGSIMAFLLLITAVIAEIIQIILSLTGVGEIISEIISFTCDFVFFIWFALLGVEYMGRNAMIKMGAAFAVVVVEFIPFINDIPMFCLGVMLMINTTRKEDRADAKKKAKKLAEEQKKRQQELVKRQSQVMGRIQQRQVRAAAQQYQRAAANDNFEAANDEYQDEYAQAA